MQMKLWGVEAFTLPTLDFESFFFFHDFKKYISFPDDFN